MSIIGMIFLTIVVGVSGMVIGYFSEIILGRIGDRWSLLVTAILVGALASVASFALADSLLLAGVPLAYGFAGGIGALLLGALAVIGSRRDNSDSLSSK